MIFESVDSFTSARLRIMRWNSDCHNYCLHFSRDVVDTISGTCKLIFFRIVYVGELLREFGATPSWAVIRRWTYAMSTVKKAINTSCSNFYMLRKPNKFAIYSNTFKRITLSFVCFCQVIFFWVVILHMIKSIIGNISQTLSKSSQCQ